MPETAVEQCGGYDLLENLFGKNYLLTNRSGFQIADINSIQSDTGNEDQSEKEVISFQIILQQQVNDNRVQDVNSLQKSTSATSVPDNTELLQENIEKANPFEMQNTHLCGNPHGMEKNPNTTHSFKEKSDEFSFLIQKGETGVEQEYPSNQIINIIPSSTILSDTFIDYPENVIQNSNQRLLMKNRMVTTVPQFNIDNYFTSYSDKNNFFSFSLPSGEISGMDSQQNGKVTFTNNASFLFGTETNVMDSLTNENPLNRLDIAGAKLLKSHKYLQERGESIFGTVQESGSTGSDTDGINVKELPTTFKSQSHHITQENMYTPFVHEVNVLTITEERDKRNDLLKINGDISSRQNITAVQQSDKEGNLSNNLTQGQSNTNHTPVDVQIQKTRSSLADTQKTTNGTQLSSIDFQQNMEVLSGNSISQLFSTESRINSEIHVYHENSTTGTEFIHSSIIEQLFKKISMVNHGDRSEIKLDLAPPELGNVKIHFAEENGEIEAKIFVENAEVKAAIENNVQRLKESMAASGLEIQKLEVYIQNDKSYEEKSSENPETKNQHHYQAKNRGGGSNGDYYECENDISNAMKKEFNRKTTNLMVDYII